MGPTPAELVRARVDSCSALTHSDVISPSTHVTCKLSQVDASLPMRNRDQSRGGCHPYQVVGLRYCEHLQDVLERAPNSCFQQLLGEEHTSWAPTDHHRRSDDKSSVKKASVSTMPLIKALMATHDRLRLYLAHRPFQWDAFVTCLPQWSVVTDCCRCHGLRIDCRCLRASNPLTSPLAIRLAISKGESLGLARACRFRPASLAAAACEQSDADMHAEMICMRQACQGMLSDTGLGMAATAIT